MKIFSSLFLISVCTKHTANKQTNVYDKQTSVSCLKVTYASIYVFIFYSNPISMILEVDNLTRYTVNENKHQHVSLCAYNLN